MNNWQERFLLEDGKDCLVQLTSLSLAQLVTDLNLVLADVRDGHSLRTRDDVIVGHASFAHAESGLYEVFLFPEKKKLLFDNTETSLEKLLVMVLSDDILEKLQSAVMHDPILFLENMRNAIPLSKQKWIFKHEWNFDLDKDQVKHISNVLETVEKGKSDWTKWFDKALLDDISKEEYSELSEYNFPDDSDDEEDWGAKKEPGIYPT